MKYGVIYEVSCGCKWYADGTDYRCLSHRDQQNVEELRPSNEWARSRNVLILDDDGWRDGCALGAKTFAEPISLEEYIERENDSTIGPAGHSMREATYIAWTCPDCGAVVRGGDHECNDVSERYEDPGEDITAPDIPLSPETIEKLAEEHGIALPDWTPTMPTSDDRRPAGPDGMGRTPQGGHATQDPEIGASSTREYNGIVRLTWYGSECEIDVGDERIDEYLADLEGKRVRVTVEVLP